MFLSNAAMASASAEIRALAFALLAEVGDLDHPAHWSGRDADDFQHEWRTLVHQRLLVAADKLDGVSFSDLTEGFGG